MSNHDSQSAFSLEITKDNGNIKICALTKAPDDEKTVRHYEAREISDTELNKLCTAVMHLLNSANRQGKMDSRTLNELQKAGQLLYDSLLTSHVKKKLSETDLQNLLLIVDDNLVHIPWELLYDGKSFLCRRFNMGRLVRTSQKISDSASRVLHPPLKMLLIADPRSDLEAAYKEGLSLRDELDNNLDIIEVDLKSSLVDAPSIKSSLRDYDILHYAGHADYNSLSPSDSGFLIQGGKLTASDIGNMSGPAPLPALVFSNACKSGHTDRWKVNENYETEIYGIANAFLLAGVQHYIGTFWDVQDEPSLYFARDFYRELVKGAMVGEAIRKARSRLAERYGEDTIIWASYMLYGDPSTRYVGQSVPEKPERPTSYKSTDEEHSETEQEYAGNVRGADTEIVFPRKRHHWIFISAAVIIALLLVVSFFKTKSERPEYREASIPDNDLRTEARQARIDNLVNSLITDYRNKQNAGEPGLSKENLRDIPAVVFINIKANGIPEQDKEYIITGVTGRLNKSGRVHIVERAILDKLLEELKISTSELVNPAKALEIGRILSAQLISTGSISKDGRSWQVSLRFIDTETTAIEAALTRSMTWKGKDELTSMLSSEILGIIREEYPLKGNIISFKDNEVSVNLGSRDGLTTGVRMVVLPIAHESSDNKGIIEITSVNESTSRARVIEIQGEYKEGLRVEESL